jgi:hypothetical protein
VRSEKQKAYLAANPEKSKSARKKSWASRTHESRKRTIDAIHAAAHTPETHAKIGATRKVSQAGYGRVADSVKAHWATLSPDARRDRIQRSLVAGAKLYTLLVNEGGGEVRHHTMPFHSSWEASLAQVLTDLGIYFQAQVPFDLGGRLYVADFVLSPNIVIEVKGTRPECWRRWQDEVRPAIEEHLVGRVHVYLLPRNIGKQAFTTLADLLAAMERVV